MTEGVGRPLRVTLLTTYYHPVIGGVETHARQIAGELHVRGVDVRVVTRRLQAGTPRTELVDGVRVERVGPAGGRTRLAKWSLLPFAFAHLVRQQPRPDVIFCPDYRGIGLAALAAGRIRRCPVVLQAETPGALSCSSWDDELAAWRIPPDGRLARVLKWPLQRAYASAAMYNCISREIEQEAIACGIPRARLASIPHAVDVRRFSPASAPEREQVRAALGWPADRLICLFLGRLSVEKGILDLLDAWTEVARPHALLVVVGPDMAGHPLDAGRAARAFVGAHALAESVLFAGPVADPAPILRAADVFVQPSHYEAFGISAIEAMASALPIVATRTGGLVDFLVHEETALLCAPRAPRELAILLDRVLTGPDLRSRLGSRARAAAVERFDTRLIAEAYMRLFHDVATAESRPAEGA